MSSQNHYKARQVDQYNNLIDNIESKLRSMTTRRPIIKKTSQYGENPPTDAKKAYSEYQAARKDDPLVHQSQLFQKRRAYTRPTGRSYLSEKVMKNPKKELSFDQGMITRLPIPKPSSRLPIVNAPERTEVSSTLLPSQNLMNMEAKYKAQLNIDDYAESQTAQPALSSTQKPLSYVKPEL